jgi:hypothetical protein
MLAVAAGAGALLLAATAAFLANPDENPSEASGTTPVSTTRAPATSAGGTATTTGATTTTVKLPPGTSALLLQDDFSDRSGQWTGGERAEGTVRYTDGAFRFRAVKRATMQSRPSGLTVTEPSVRLDVSARRMGGPIDAGYGLFCRWDPTARSMYKLEIQDNGAYTIDKLQGGKWASKPLAVGVSGGIIKRGKVNRIQAECSGERDGGPVTLSLRVNGQLMQRVEDRSDTLPPSGAVGLLTTTYDTGPFDVAFDDFAAYAL